MKEKGGRIKRNRKEGGGRRKSKGERKLETEDGTKEERVKERGTKGRKGREREGKK